MILSEASLNYKRHSGSSASLTSSVSPGWKAVMEMGLGALQGLCSPKKRSTCRWTFVGYTWWLWSAPRAAMLGVWAKSSPEATGCVTPEMAAAGWTGRTAGVRR